MKMLLFIINRILYLWFIVQLKASITLFCNFSQGKSIDPSEYAAMAVVANLIDA